jgi:hypothetical protein
MATRKEMEDAIRKIDEDFGADAELILKVLIY